MCFGSSEAAWSRPVLLASPLFVVASEQGVIGFCGCKWLDSTPPLSSKSWATLGVCVRNPSVSCGWPHYLYAVWGV